MSNVELRLRPGHDSVVIDGEDIANQISHLTLTHSAEGLPILTVEYPCFEVQVDGLAEVVHYCPLAEVSDEV